MTDLKTAKTAQRQLKGLTVALTIQFILGALLTTVINYNPNKHSAVQTTVLLLHVLLAIGILAAAIARLAVSIKTHELVGLSSLGIISGLIAFGGGIVAANTGNNLAVFLMAMGFITAMAAYGSSMKAVRTN